MGYSTQGKLCSPIKAGERVANMTVCKVHMPDDPSQTKVRHIKYTVRRDCCPAETTISYSHLRKIQNYGGTPCRECASIEREAAKKARPKRNKVKFDIGRFVAGIEIIDLVERYGQKEVRYAVRYPCCQQTGTMTRSALYKRLSKTSVLCPICGTNLLEAERKVEKERAERALLNPAAVPAPSPASPEVIAKAKAKDYKNAPLAREQAAAEREARKQARHDALAAFAAPHRKRLASRP